MAKQPWACCTPPPPRLLHTSTVTPSESSRHCKTTKRLNTHKQLKHYEKEVAGAGAGAGPSSVLHCRRECSGCG